MGTAVGGNMKGSRLKGSCDGWQLMMRVTPGSLLEHSWNTPATSQGQALRQQQRACRNRVL